MKRPVWHGEVLLIQKSCWRKRSTLPKFESVFRSPKSLEMNFKLSNIDGQELLRFHFHWFLSTSTVCWHTPVCCKAKHNKNWLLFNRMELFLPVLYIYIIIVPVCAVWCFCISSDEKISNCIFSLNDNHEAFIFVDWIFMLAVSQTFTKIYK